MTYSKRSKAPIFKETKTYIHTPPTDADNVTEEQVQEAIKKVKAKKYEWNEKSLCSYYYEKDTGKIVGQYSRVNFSDDIYHATVNGDNLGEYISEKCARKAVEDFITKNDEQYAEMKAKSPYLFGDGK